MKDPISSGTATRLIVRLRAQRLINRAGTAISRLRSSSRKSRGALGRTRLGGLLVLAAFLYFGFQSADRAVRMVFLTFEPSRDAVEGVPEAALLVFAGQFSLLLLGSLFAALGNRNVTAPEWDLEWLATLPVGIPALLWIRLLERTVTNPIALVSVWPLASLLAARTLPLPLAVIVGALVALPLLSVVAALQTVFDCGLNVRLRPSAVQNLQAAASVLGAVCLVLAYVLSSIEGDRVRELASQVPSWVFWTFPVAAARLLTDARWDVRPLLALALECGVIVVLARALVGYLLRHGIVAAGARESRRSSVDKPGASLSKDAAPDADGRARDTSNAWLSPLIRRELFLLLRDRSFLVQTALLPILLVAFRFALSRPEDHSGQPPRLAQPTSSGSQLSAEVTLALGLAVAAYTLMFALLQTWRHEGRSLWILYALPKPLSTMLAHKAGFWASFAAMYPIAAAVVVGFQSGLSARLLWLTAIALGGVVLCATLATALSVLGAAPTSLEPRARFKLGHVVVYAIVSVAYGSALLSPTLWDSAVILLLTSAAAFAFWQIARERLPFLLDPSAEPGPSLTLGHGLIAALGFFQLQPLVANSLRGLRQQSPEVRTALSVALAGALIFIAARLTFALSGIKDFPRILGKKLGHAALLGAGAGISASLVGLLYFAAMDRLQWVRRSTTALSVAVVPWLTITNVLVSPVFEELIFRGLLFGGLRRAFSFARAAILSALVFAAFYGPASAPALVFLGLCAAWAYEQTGLLIAPMLCHVLYKASLVWLSS